MSAGKYIEIAGGIITDRTKTLDRTDSDGTILHQGKQIKQQGKKGGVEFNDSKKDKKEELKKNDIVAKLFWIDLDKKHTEIPEDGIIYISAIPEMPKVDLRLEVPPSYYLQNLRPVLPFYAVLEIEYKVDQGSGDKRKYRNDLQRYPIDQQYSINITPTAETPIFFSPANFMNNKGGENKNVVFKADILPFYKDVFRGGKATLKIYSDKNQNNLVKKMSFQIRGKNPTKQNVKDYLTEKNHIKDFWFIYRVLLQESGSSDRDVILQFNQKKKEMDAGKDYLTNTEGTPNWGYPDGWGLAQIDHGGVNNPKMYLNSNILWSWKLCIGQAIVDLKDMIKNMVGNDEIQSVLLKIRHFEKKNPGKAIVAQNKIEGPYTYVQAPSSCPGLETLAPYFTRDIPLQANEKSILDAHVIRKNNGGYFLNKIDLDKGGNGIWVIDDTSPRSGNYVEHISKMPD